MIARLLERALGRVDAAVGPWVAEWQAFKDRCEIAYASERLRAEIDELDRKSVGPGLLNPYNYTKQRDEYDAFAEAAKPKREAISKARAALCDKLARLWEVHFDRYPVSK